MGILDRFRKKKARRRSYAGVNNGRLFADFASMTRSSNSELKPALRILRKTLRKPQFAASLRLVPLSRIEPPYPSGAVSCGGHNLLWHVLRCRLLFLRPLIVRLLSIDR